jgi:small neutral amino acid transporter SnatA (MarC family)
MNHFVRSTVLLIVILNPFALSIYLIDMLRQHSTGTVLGIMLRACAISGAVFVTFALVGNGIFQDVLQARFASFQIFGGILFLVIALRFMVGGGQALITLRGTPGHVAGAVAMPFMIGPGTVSAAMLAGTRLRPALATLSILAALAFTTFTLVALKVLFDRVRATRESLVERYAEVTGRVAALVIGTIACEMILQGVESWLAGLHATS